MKLKGKEILIITTTLILLYQTSAKTINTGKNPSNDYTNVDSFDINKIKIRNKIKDNTKDSNEFNKRTRNTNDYNQTINDISYIDYNNKYSNSKKHKNTDDVSSETLHHVYELLTYELSAINSRVNNVENVTNDILTKLTSFDCSDLKSYPTGEYTLHLNHKGKRPVKVRCNQDLDGGGWTVIQQRLPKEKENVNDSVSFDRNWHDYKVGFGVPYDDYWIGLENIYLWTNTRHYELRIELSDFQNDSAYGNYNRFYIEDENNGYKLHVLGFNGTSGDSLGGNGKLDNFTANGLMFSTKDHDNDASDEINCTKYWNTGGWWFNRCSWANLNGPYLFPTPSGNDIGINWHKWRNKQFLKSSIMMIRPIKLN